MDVLPDGLDGPVQLLNLVHRLKAVLVLGARVGVVPLHGTHHVVQDWQKLARLKQRRQESGLKSVEIGHFQKRKSQSK